uniref:Zgc:101858 n=1 Tax=Hucho hucho TaxID=62062 RepID=A0A4W5M8X9_9TELE
MSLWLKKQTISHLGRLDVLINSTGILAMSSIKTGDLAQYDEVMNVNVRSVYHLTQLCVPHLIKTKGSIVTVSSGNGVYYISKSAIDQFTRCIALELVSKQVRVSSVRAGLDEEQHFLEKCKQTHALGRPGEVAQAIAFMVSDAVTFITGVNLPVDGALCHVSNIISCDLVISGLSIQNPELSGLCHFCISGPETDRLIKCRVCSILV